MRGVLKCVCVVVVVVGCIIGSARAGSLTPPAGPVGATLKTLHEVEPRIPVGPLTTPGNASATYVISQTGSYYLTGNVLGEANKEGIRITAPNVTLDLNGYTLDGQNVGTLGVNAFDVNAYGATVRNGAATRWDVGVEMFNSESSLIESVTTISNSAWGMRSGPNGRIVNCASQTNGQFGFILRDNSSVEGSVASSNFGSGFSGGQYTVIVNCRSSDNSVNGFAVGSYSSFSDCVAANNSNDGFSLSNATVTNCVAYNNGDDGFDTSSSSVLRGCVAGSNASDGFEAGTGTLLSECVARSNLASGFTLASGATALDCSAIANFMHGVIANANSRVSGGTMWSNGSAIADGCGVLISSTDTRVEGVHAIDNDYGVRAMVAGSLVIGCSGSGNLVADLDVAIGINGPTLIADPTDQALGNFDF